MTSTEFIRITGSDGLLSAIPALLGFHPVDSIVVAGLAPQSNGLYRIQPVARIDLADYLTNPERNGGYLAQLMLRNAIPAVAVAIYSPDPDETTSNLAVAALPVILEAAGLQVVNAILTDNIPAEINPELHAEAVAKGEVISATRDEMRSWVEFHPGSPPPSEDLLGSLRTIKGRDDLICKLIVDYRRNLPSLLAACQGVRDDGTPPAETAAVVSNLAAVTAVIAYRCGNGALAQIAIDRALRIDTHHRLAHLLLAAIGEGISPDELGALAGAL